MRAGVFYIIDMIREKNTFYYEEVFFDVKV